MRSLRLVRETFSGFLTSRVPGVPFTMSSTRWLSCSMMLRSWPITRTEIGAEIGGPFCEFLHIDMRARVALEPLAQRLQPDRSFVGVVFVQLHEHFGVVGRVVALDVVVVDLRVAVPEVREPAPDLGHLRKLVLDDAQRAIGLGQRSAVRRFDLDQELRRVRLGKQAGADHGHQRLPTATASRRSRPPP